MMDFIVFLLPSFVFMFGLGIFMAIGYVLIRFLSIWMDVVENRIQRYHERVRRKMINNEAGPPRTLDMPTVKHGPIKWRR